MTLTRIITWIIIGIIASLIAGVVIYPYTYGGEGKLEISVILEKSEMSINETINATVVVKNVDDRPIRVMRLFRSTWMFLKYSNGSTVEYTGKRLLMSPPTNSELMMLKPGDSISRNQIISRLNWDLKNNSIHLVYVQLQWSEKISFLLNFPHWHGSIVSDEVELKVS